MITEITIEEQRGCRSLIRGVGRLREGGGCVLLIFMGHVT